MHLEWIPLERLGPFIFGDRLDKYVTQYNLSLVPDEYHKAVDWKVYRINTDDEIRVYSECGKIEAVASETYCLYHNKNILGLPVDKVLSLLGAAPVSIEQEVLSEGPQDVYEFDDFGLQLWVKDGIAVTTICSGHCEDE